MTSLPPTRPCTIAVLPVEILLHGIFHLLDGRTILRCSLVCRAWQEIITACTELKYNIELWADGLLPAHASGLSPVEKLENLHKWRRTWQTIAWTSRTEVPINAHPRAYELVGGVFAQQNTWPESDFTAIRLPSSRCEGETMSTQNIGIESLDFAMDPTQDLVVFLHEGPGGVGNFDCRAMSSLQPHPRAPTPTLSFDLRDEILRRIFLQVADDVVGLLFRTSETDLRVVLFNWRTGAMLVDLGSSEFPPAVSDFALLSPRAFILGCTDDIGRPKGGEIHIYTFDGTHHNCPALVATLELPLISPGRALLRVIAHSGPLCAGALPGAQFSKANDKRICVISLAYDNAEFYSVYVHHRYLATHLANTGAPRTVPWDAWGGPHTRMLPGRHRFWLRYVHGERVVRPVDPACPDRVEILDFGITPSRPGFAAASAPTPWSEVCTEPSTIPRDGHVFADDVTTALPYRRTARHLDTNYILFLIDQDRIVGLNDLADKLTVYTF
ncbi:hypothetical protein DFH09DRAFT_1041364 [Mycena vulgaris]|nr:hypothetical protein DFH09DRAFT_1041364 [Mycena vulgaris]